MKSDYRKPTLRNEYWMFRKKFNGKKMEKSFHTICSCGKHPLENHNFKNRHETLITITQIKTFRLTIRTVITMDSKFLLQNFQIFN